MRLAALAATLLALLTTACGVQHVVGIGDPTDPTVHLSVTVQDWSGWQREQPEAVHRTVDIAQGQGFTVEVLGERLAITLTEVTGETIRLETSDDMVPADGGFDDSTRTFLLPRGGEVELGTPSMDAGTTVTITE
jgi:hypothetical protein